MSLNDYGLTLQRAEALIFFSAAAVAIIILLCIFLRALRGFAVYQLMRSKEIKKAWYSFIPVLNYLALGELAAGRGSARKKILGKLSAVFAAAAAVIVFIGSVLLIKGAVSLMFAADAAAVAGAEKISEAEWQPLINAISVIFLGLLFSILKGIVSAIVLGYIYSYEKRTPVLAAIGFVFPILIPVFLYTCVTGKSNSTEVKQ